MSTARGVKVVGYYDCPGGGQVVVRKNVAYVGHVKPPHGTSIIDIADPANPRELAYITVPEGTLSHKVRVENEVMLVNREVFPIGRVDPNFRGGLEVFDVSNPSKPRHITTWAARARDRPLVDARAMDYWRREADLERHRPSLPSSDTGRQSLVHQLLARRVCHPRHRRYHQTKVHLRVGLEPT